MKPLFCKYTTLKLVIFSNTSGRISSDYILLSDKSKADILWHSNNPIRSEIPSAPNLFLLIWKVDSFYRVESPVIFYIILSLRLRLTKFVSLYNPLISLNKFYWI